MVNSRSTHVAATQSPLSNVSKKVGICAEKLHGGIFVLSKLGVFALRRKLPVKVSLKLHQELVDGVNPVV